MDLQHRAAGKVNILMVDDQPAKLLSYEAILGELNENLIKASSAKEALEHLLKSDIAVLLMDVSMPEMDGFELAEMIRQHPRFQKTAIIFISAVHLTDVDRVKGYQRGAVDYISVPVVPELLRAKVSVFAELHRKSRQLELLNQDLRNLSSRLISLQDDERRRVARDLHDGLGQELSAAKMMVDGALSTDLSPLSRQAAGQASALLGAALVKIRSMSHLLHPPLLDEIGLGSALHWYIDGLTQRSGIAANLDLQPEEFPRFAPDVETAIFRIVQEGLTNAFRHSAGTKVTVRLALLDGRLAISVHDNGKGISPHVEQLAPEGLGIGIGGMRQRVSELGGEMRLRNTRPGTLLEVVFAATPLPPRQDLPVKSSQFQAPVNRS
jgi:signal transduction histidine kinase